MNKSAIQSKQEIEEATTTADMSKLERKLEVRSPSNRPLPPDDPVKPPLIVINRIDSGNHAVVTSSEKEEEKVSVGTPEASSMTSGMGHYSSKSILLKEAQRHSSFELKSEGQFKVSENLISVIDEKLENFDDYSYVNKLHRSLTKSVKEVSSFKGRRVKRESQAKF